MHVESRVTISVSPEKIFEIYADVPNWKTWDPDTKEASIDGPFQTGSKGKITPPKGISVPMNFISVVPNKSFTVDSQIPLFRMVFEHELNVTAAGTEVVHRVTFSGALSFLLGRIVGNPLRTGLPITLASLKRLAETGSVAD
ncbi:SRPBCC family protein [Massilia sp. DJPM01]|uniref:SRPBCC family protein n=1 Tax=Massilia sp. DJPM01 TaxID=3024404 RepID=UPI00259EFC0D|nr:SRPBCC family protein [Massilia sp. DJPM01]MDM5180126.1 SRPBCC family protein [Massilia sp. DJPM01]